MDEDIIMASRLRNRSHNFTKEEVKCLVNLIEKYKTIVLRRAINSAANKAKEIAWSKITETFNSQGFEYHRTIESLKNKWENLKRKDRKLSSNFLDVNLEEFDEVTSKIVNLLQEAEYSTHETHDMSEEIEAPEDEEEDESKSSLHDSEKICDENNDKDSKAPQIVRPTRKIAVRSSKWLGKRRDVNFTPKECSILLNCVRSEKEYIFSKSITAETKRLKNEAWARITRSFNKLSPHQRSTKALQFKFQNLKRVVVKEPRSFMKKDMKLEEEDNNKTIKREPEFEIEIEPEQDDSNDEHDYKCDDPMESFNGVNSNHNSPQGIPDPLATVLSSDSGFGYMTNDPGRQSEDSEVTKLKLELLQYQLDNAKLERERIEKAMRAEEQHNETRAIEASLRLRAARLEAIAAATKLPPSHPDLKFTPQEEKGQEYLDEYRT